MTSDTYNTKLIIKMRINPDRQNIKSIAVYLFTLFVAVYLVTASGPGFYSTDAAVLRSEVARSIIERMELTVPEESGIRGADGKYYSWLGIGSSLFALPLYSLGLLFEIDPEITISITNQLIAAATVSLIFLFAFLLGYSKHASLLTAIFYGIATMAWPHAKHPFDHTIETFFILLAVYLTSSYAISKKLSHLLWASAAIGFAFITRMTSILATPALLFLLAGSNFSICKSKIGRHEVVRNYILIILVFLPFLILNLWYNYHRFGSIWETGYQLISERLGIPFFFGTPLMKGLIGFLISPGKGFFFYSPVAILFFFSIKTFLKKNPRLGTAFIFIIVTYLLFYSGNMFWHGDWAWGPRYLLAITPFLMIPIAGLFDSGQLFRNKFGRLIIYFILVLSIVIQIAAVSVNYEKYFLTLRFIEQYRFDIYQGPDVPAIVEPSPYIYYNYKISPIISQFTYIKEIASNINNYTYKDIPVNSSVVEKIAVFPGTNVFDFWWLYRYFTVGSYSGVLAAFFLLLFIIYTFARLLSAVKS